MRDDPRFWMVLLAFSITTLAMAIFLTIGRWIWVVATGVRHNELVLIGTHLARTRKKAR